MTILPAPEEAGRLTRVIQDHLQWSAFWDKRHGRDADAVIDYITAHSS